MIRAFQYSDVLAIAFAARWTLLLTAIAFVGASCIGLLIAVCRMAQFAPLRWLAIAYSQVVQGTPLLVWLFLLYFGVAMFGYDVNAWAAATAAFSIYGGAFLGEIWFGALASIAKTQWEAGSSLSLSFFQLLRYVIVPQSIRVAIPPTVGFLVQLTKNTSLASTIGLFELTRAGQLTSAATYRPLTVYLTVSAIYFLICFPISHWSRVLERKFDVAR